MLLVRNSIWYVIISGTPMVFPFGMPSGRISSRPVQHSTCPVSCNFWHCAANFPSAHQSSASKKARYFPFARWIPRFRLFATPRFSLLQSSTTFSPSAYLSIISTVLSQEQSSITNNSSGTSWLNTDSIACAIYFPAL